MDLWRMSYNLAGLPLLRLAARFWAPFSDKVSRALEGRKRSFRDIESYLAALPQERASRPGIWFHAVSVGEYLQALPVMRGIKSARAETPIYLSFFSPSVERAAMGCDAADVSFYLPEDTPGNMQRLVSLLRPGLLVISKFDIWPNMIALTREAGVPAAVIAGTLSPDSGRSRGLARRFHRSFYRHLSLVCAISGEDALGFQRLGVGQSRCVITGDTRFDQTYERAAKVGPDDQWVRLFSGWESCCVLACGSIWPADQEHLLPAAASLMERHPELRLILVPHEPTDRHLEELSGFLEASSIPFRRFSELKSGLSEGISALRAVLVDQTGVLAAIYRAADIAYVGGSFSSGVHNTMEPACFELPVVFGPRYLNSYEARLMLERGGAFSFADSAQAGQVLEVLIADKAARDRAGKAARAVITGNLGATGRTLAALAGHFPETCGFLNAKERKP